MYLHIFFTSHLRIKQLFFFFISLLISINSLAQTTITGKVVDKKTKEPLAFTHIIVNDKETGVMTDIDGGFTITHSNITLITCSYVGYKTKEIQVFPDQHTYTIQLEVDENELSLVELVAKENPAHRIIREVIKNKNTHNPERLNSFKYECYNKVIYDFIYGDSKKSDSIRQETDNVLNGGHMLISESVTERKYLYPEYSEETILATRFSGIKNPTFSSLATDLQPFSFYEDVIPFLDVNYLNPISEGSLNKYQFYLRDTIVHELDTTFVINYYPIKGKNFEGLKGLLYVNTNGFAIENVIAEPFEEGKITLKIQQKYITLPTGEWFPEQLNYALRFKEYPSKDVQIGVDGKSYISKVKLDENYRRKDFSIDQVKLSPLASKKSQVFWDTHRPFTLNTREQTTYQVIDSIGEEYHLDTYFKISENLVNGKIDFNYFEIDVTDALGANLYEGFRLGLGVYTGDSISETFKLGGYWAYGFKDKDAKYGASLRIDINKDKESQIKLAYQDDVQEFGVFHHRNLGPKGLTQRNFLASEMNKLKQYSLSWKTRAFRYLQTEFSVGQHQFTPQYDYVYQGQEFNSLKVASFGVNLRYAFKEKYIQTMNQRVSMGTKYPVLSCTFKTIEKDVLESEYAFTSLKVRMEYNKFWKNFGKTNLTIETGKIFNELPAPLLFSGEGSLDDRLRLFVPQTFQTVTPYEFLSNEFAHVFLRHNFGSLLFKTEKFKPQFSLVHNMGWSRLSNPEDHLFEEGKTDMSKGFMESGLIIDNIFRINYVNIGYLGFGAGVFGRYGAYAYEDAEDNLVFKLSMIFTTR